MLFISASFIILISSWADPPAWWALLCQCLWFIINQDPEGRNDFYSYYYYSVYILYIMYTLMPIYILHFSYAFIYISWTNRNISPVLGIYLHYHMQVICNTARSINSTKLGVSHTMAIQQCMQTPLSVPTLPIYTTWVVILPFHHALWPIP